jgi:hypothetical protein
MLSTAELATVTKVPALAVNLHDLDIRFAVLHR